MSERVTGDERRKSERVDATLALNLHLELPGVAEGLAPETLNVSSTGVYFRTTRYVEPMTKLSLDFEVPTDDSGTIAPIHCEGIVARVIPEIPAPDVEHYDVAVFFTVIDAEGLSNLESYIALRLTP